MKTERKNEMLKTPSNPTKTVLNFQDGFGCYGVCLVLKIALRRSDGVKRAVLSSKLARLT
ncbi:hypothetical protein ABHP48_22825 (plasmid) [Providencia huaxiensis]